MLVAVHRNTKLLNLAGKKTQLQDKAKAINSLKEVFISQHLKIQIFNVT